MKLAEYAEFIKSVTRPFCLVVMVVVIGLMVYQEKVVPTWFWGTFTPWFIWWSVDRSLKHLSDRRVK